MLVRLKEQHLEVTAVEVEVVADLKEALDTDHGELKVEEWQKEEESVIKKANS